MGPRRAPLRIGQNKLEASLGYVVSLSLACLHDDIPSPISGALDFVLFLFLAERGSLLYSPGDPPASASLMLELQLCVTIPSLLNVFFCYCCCFSTHDFSEDADHPGTHFVDRLPLPPKSWDQGVHHHTRPSCTFLISFYIPIAVLPTLDISYEYCLKGNSLIYFKSRISLSLF